VNISILTILIEDNFPKAFVYYLDATIY